MGRSVELVQYVRMYKYQLAETYCIQLPVPVIPTEQINTDWIALDKTGQLTIQKGYAWDGVHDLIWRTRNTMRGSLVHDALYQLMREGYLHEDTWREAADENLRILLLEDGMGVFRSWYYLRGVRMFGQPCADPAHNKPVLNAP